MDRVDGKVGVMEGLRHLLSLSAPHSECGGGRSRHVPSDGGSELGESKLMMFAKPEFPKQKLTKEGREALTFKFLTAQSQNVTRRTKESRHRGR